MSGLVFEKLTQYLSAGEVWRLTIAADFFRIAAASWPVKVRILKAGRILGEMDGWQAGDFVRDVQFDAVEVEAGSIAQTVTVQIAGGGVGSDRVLGEVSVIDGERARTEAQKAFIFSAARGAAAGVYPYVGLRNPIGSGKKLVISSFMATTSLAATVYLKKDIGGVDDVGVAPRCKDWSSAASAALAIRGDTATIGGSGTTGESVWSAALSAGGVIKYDLRAPFVINEGERVALHSNAAQSLISLTLEFFEE